MESGVDGREDMPAQPDLSGEIRESIQVSHLQFPEKEIEKGMEVERRFEMAQERCRASGYGAEAVAGMGALIDSCFADSAFRGTEGWCWRSKVLNEVAFLLADERLREVVWEKTRALAAETTDEGMRISLVTGFSNWRRNRPGELPWFLDLLFGLADDPRTRWAVFYAYENWPNLFPEHIRRYGRGRISEDEYRCWREEIPKAVPQG